MHKERKVFRWIILLACWSGGWAWSSYAGAPVSDPAETGPFSVTRVTVNIPGTEEANLQTDLYHPSRDDLFDPDAGPAPAILLAHGFSQSKEQHVNQGLHLASRGYVVLIPNSNAASDHSRFADDLSRCIDWLEERNADPDSVLHNRVRIDRIGATGHSAGGLSAILATSRDPRIRAVSPMDPVDGGGLGAAALANMAAPAALTWSEPSSCNASGSAIALYAAATGPRRGVRVVGANHTDPQDPASLLSALFCGGANSARQSLYRRYMAGWFEYHLRDDARYGPWVFADLPGAVAEDLSAGRITWQETADPAAAWRFVHFGSDADDEEIAGDFADPDGDGFPNLIEYAFNTDPKEATSRPAISAATREVEERSHLVLSFLRLSRARDLAYRVEASTDLLEWELIHELAPGESPHGKGGVWVEEEGLQRITIQDPLPLSHEGRRFLRLQVARLAQPPFQ